jgi:hypothetical protein
MDANNYKKVKEILIEFITDISFKSLLESYDEVSDLYDNNQITHDDFEKMLKEIKTDASVNNISSKPQIDHYFKEFTRLANKFWDEGDMELYNYWKGQVMGMSHLATTLGIDIDTNYWLKQIP